MEGQLQAAAAEDASAKLSVKQIYKPENDEGCVWNSKDAINLKKDDSELDSSSQSATGTVTVEYVFNRMSSVCV